MIRWLVAIPASFFVVVMLFANMSSLVHHKAYLQPEKAPTLSFDFLTLEPESALVRKQRKVSVPPEISAIPELSTNLLSPTMAKAPLSDLPRVTLGMGTVPYRGESGISQAGMDLGGLQLDIDLPSSEPLAPVVKIEPIYPLVARMKGIEGYVVVSFRLGTDGRPRNAKVVEAKPRRVFEREALRAVRQWQYARPKAGAKINSVTTVRLEFTLSQ